MVDFEGQRWLGRNGTDVPAFQAVGIAITKLVRKQYGGWSASDREDLEQQVFEKYFHKFGRGQLPDGKDGDPAVPIPWLMTVIRNCGVDFHRRQEVRPAYPVDFQGPDAFVWEGLLNAIDPPENLSLQVANRLDQQRQLLPALHALESSHPMDVKLLEWRFIQDRDFEYIGKVLVKSPETAKKSVQRALNRLRDVMAMPSTTMTD